MKLPKVLYVKREADGEDYYFVATDKVNDLAEIGEVIPIGIYKLDSKTTAEGIVKVK